MHKIEINLQKHRVVVVFEDKLAPNHQAWETELFAACQSAKNGGGHFDILSDFSKSDLMTQSGAEDSAQTVKWCLDNGLRKSANIVGSSLMKLQLNRITGTEKIRNFANRQEAEAWLDS